MLSEKIALKKLLIEALTEQLRIEKTELKRLESKQSRLATFFELQGSLLDDPDTRDSLTGSLHTPTAIAPRVIEITEPSYKLRLIEIAGDEPKAIATPADEVVEVEAVTPQQPPSLDEVAPLDEMQSYRREELYRQIENAMKAISMKVKEARKDMELMFGNGIITRDQLNIEQLEKFLAHLNNLHSEKVSAIANTIKVEWESESSGITIDAEGEVRPFTCDNWASPTPEFILVTGEGKELKSTANPPLTTTTQVEAVVGDEPDLQTYSSDYGPQSLVEAEALGLVGKVERFERYPAGLVAWLSVRIPGRTCSTKGDCFWLPVGELFGEFRPLVERPRVRTERAPSAFYSLGSVKTRAELKQLFTLLSTYKLPISPSLYHTIIEMPDGSK